jgi:hypothetical protein
MRREESRRSGSFEASMRLARRRFWPIATVLCPDLQAATRQQTSVFKHLGYLAIATPDIRSLGVAQPLLLNFSQSSQNQRYKVWVYSKTTSFKDENDVVLQGNDTTYGLGAGVDSGRRPCARGTAQPPPLATTPPSDELGAFTSIGSGDTPTTISRLRAASPGARGP